jgi:molybdopterin-containing oxidoreductase family iron-sulfur binding subunit
MSDTERTYWKSLDELRQDSLALARRRREFAEPLPIVPAGQEPPSQGRRDFLTVMGFSLAAATLACSRAPVQTALPLVSQPEELTPGLANWYATTCGGCSAGCSLLVKTRDGRPIKVEGNPDSALFGGGTCAVGQATVLSLYDEERLRGPSWRGRPVSWQELDTEVQSRLHAIVARGERVVLLSGPILGPTTRDLVARWAASYSGFRHVVYEPRSLAALRRASQRCFGQPVVPHFRLDSAALVLSLEADFLGTWLSPVEFTRQYARRRSPEEGMVRHVQVESGLSLTGANADRRHVVLPSEAGLVALALLRRLQQAAGHATPAAPSPPLPLPEAEVDALAADLWRSRGQSLVVCGVPDTAAQVVTAAINHVLGNYGTTLDLGRPSLQQQADDEDMARLVEDMRRGDVQALIVYGVNPAYDFPDGPRFLAALERVALSVSLADRLDETAERTHALAPDHHFLEAWGDAEPAAGHYSLAQPTIAPLFDTRAAQETLLRWSGRAPDFHAALRAYWRREIHPRAKGAGFELDFDRFWDRALQAGVLDLPAAGTASLPAFVGDVEEAAAAVLAAHRSAAAARGPDGYELLLYETVGLRDGRHANNPWLQELPDPVTKVTWGNHASLAPATAARLGLRDGDVVELSDGATRLELPVCVQPGQSAQTVAVAVGYGRRRAGKVGNGVGASAFPFARMTGGLRRASAAGIALRKTGRTQPLAATQTHHSMEGRPLVREATLAAYRANAEAALGAPPEEQRSLWADHPKGVHTWGMTVDLSSCTGCSACVIACQAENNVAVVGADEVRRGREMHWIRIDRYYHGEADRPDTVFQPVMCQHCHAAPCETVCPVLATVHSSEGLNQQVYNRCIGTRYCENNCPYKVRRFNWFSYARNPRFAFNMSTDLGAMVLNPDVVVRSRGVMEKCSLCIQRIQAAKLDAKRAGRPLQDGAIETACQQACPARAIVFGDIDDMSTRVARLACSGRYYHLLEGIGTRPGVGYLAKIRNREA